MAGSGTPGGVAVTPPGLPEPAARVVPVAEANDYFTVRTVAHAGAARTFADARNVLLVVFGLTECSGRLVLVRQFRPPMGGTVLSAPMGCYPDAPFRTCCHWPPPRPRPRPDTGFCGSNTCWTSPARRG